MSFNTQTNVVELLGTFADRPSPTGLHEAGTLYHTTDGHGTFVLLAFANSASNVWDPIAATGATGSSGWPPYVVSTSDGPPAAFTSIQTAIDTAVSDGHGPSASAVVLIHPGAYTEDLVLADGIHLAGLSDNDDAGVVVTGAVTTGGGTTDISALNINGSVSATGTSDLALTLRKVRVTSAGATALAVANGGESSVVTLTDSVFEVQVPGGPALSVVSGTEVDADRCSFLAPDTLASANAAGSGLLNFVRCAFRGQVQLTGPSGSLFNDCDFEAFSQAVMGLSGGGGQTIFKSRIQQLGTPAPMFDGTGTNLSYDEITGFVPANFFNTGTGVATTPLAVARAHTVQPFSGAGPHAPGVAIADLSVVALPTNTNVTFVLPRTRNMPNGLRVTVRQLAGGTGQTTIDPTAGSGDSVDGGSSYVVATGDHGAEFQNDQVNQSWIRIGSF